MLSRLEIDKVLGAEDRATYEKLLTPLHNSLVHANASAEIATSVAKFLSGGRQLPDGTVDFLWITAMNAADKVVLTSIAVMDGRTDGLNFQYLAKWLIEHCTESSRADLIVALDAVQLLQRSSALIGRARDNRHKLLAHRDRDYMLRVPNLPEIRLAFDEVQELQRKTEALFTEYDFGPRRGFRPLLMDADHVHGVLELIEEHLEYHPEKAAERIRQLTRR